MNITNIEKIEREIQSLSRDEFEAFREWFYEYDAANWDRRIEADTESGKLSSLAREAIESHERGETKEL